jgi:peptide/nickel transport system substrate-binding protein
MRSARWVISILLLLSLAVAGFAAEPTRAETVIMTYQTPGTTDLVDLVGIDNFNPYALGGTDKIRAAMNKTIYEYLYLYNLYTGKEIPWLAESYKYNGDYTEISVKLRGGIKWSDGVPFTANDFAFTMDMMKAWVKNVVVRDDLNFTIVMTKPNPRFFFQYFAENTERHFTIAPKHIWEGVDPEKFTNYDPKKGWPVGTGAYKLTSQTTTIQVFDRRDDWWGYKSGFRPLPKPKRITLIPAGTEETNAQRLVDNEIDIGASLQKGVMEEVHKKNPNVNAFGEPPVWGAPDACLLTVGMNTAVEPFNDLDMRLAFNYAIDRDRVTELAYEGGVKRQNVPFSAFGGLDPYRALVKDIVDKYKRHVADPKKVVEIMTRKGYSKDSDGFWAKNGKRFSLQLDVPGWLRVLGPVVQDQLRNAGFDVEWKLYAPEMGPFISAIQGGTSKLWIFVHCGSSREPLGTLGDYHSNQSAPIGTMTPNVFANSRYSNPKYDAIIDKMAKMAPASSGQYADLTRQAVEIYLRDLPQIDLSDEMWILTFNSSYWKGWTSVKNPYTNPYMPWAGWALQLWEIEPTGKK